MPSGGPEGTGTGTTSWTASPQRLGRHYHRPLVPFAAAPAADAFSRATCSAARDGGLRDTRAWHARNQVNLRNANNGPSATAGHFAPVPTAGRRAPAHPAGSLILARSPPIPSVNVSAAGRALPQNPAAAAPPPAAPSKDVVQAVLAARPAAQQATQAAADRVQTFDAYL